jgi:hypothetical protein
MRTLACIACTFALTNAWATFRCVDANGRTHVGDTPPEACAKHATDELNRSGAVVRRIETTAASSQGNNDTGKREADRALDMRRRDRALLDSYSTLEEIDLARNRSVDSIKVRADAAGLRAEQLKQREKELTRAIASYSAAKVPPPLVADLNSVRQESAVAKASQEKSEKELDATRRRFDEDRARWLELRGVK